MCSFSCITRTVGRNFNVIMHFTQIKRLQAAAKELEARMRMVANDVAEKQRELEELGREKDRFGASGDDPQVT